MLCPGLLSWVCIIAAFARAASADFVLTDYESYNDGELGHRPHLNYHSSDEYSPLVQVNIWDRDSISDTGSHIFVKHDGNSSSTQSSPLILDAHDLSAVYMNRSFTNVFGTRIQENFGKKYLTFWQGDKGGGIGDGYGLAFDDTYRLVYKVWAQDLPVNSDLHEFAFTGNGTALVTGVDKMVAQGSDFPEEWEVPDEFEVLGSVIQELDLETNEVIFDWRALDHINPMDTFEPRGDGWDVYHTNSIQKTRAGNYLISIRHLHSIYLIDGQTGEVIWTLGGKQNDFIELPPPEGVDPVSPLLSMGWQHHAQYVPGTDETEMTFFDNHVKHTSQGLCDPECSRGLHIAINDTASPPTVQLLQEYRHPSRLQAQSQGNMQVLEPTPDDLGNVFIGWGRCPSFTEHNSTGETIMSVQISPWHSDEIPDALDNYRSYKMDWSATPWWDPAIAPRKNPEDQLVVYASWNGATEVATWVVRGAADSDSRDNGNGGAVLATSPRTGFETKLVIGETKWQYLWAEAVDIWGNVLRSSEVADLDDTELSVAYDNYEELDSTFQPRIKKKPEPMPTPTPTPTPTPSPQTEGAGAETEQTLTSSSESESESGTSLSTMMISAFLGAGMGIIVLAIIGACVVLCCRGRDYNRLKEEEEDSFNPNPNGNYRDEDVNGNSDNDGGSSNSRRSAEDVDTRSRVDDNDASDSRALLSRTEKDRYSINE